MSSPPARFENLVACHLPKWCCLDHALNRRVSVRLEAARPASAGQPFQGLFAGLAAGQAVAVTEFTEPGGLVTRLSADIARQMEPRIVKKGAEKGLKFLERRELKLILDEWRLDMAGLTDRDGAAEKTLVGADYLLTGTVSLQIDGVEVAMKLLKVETGQVVNTARVTRPLEPFYRDWAGAPLASADPAKTRGLGGDPASAASRDGSLRLWRESGACRPGEELTVLLAVTAPLHVALVAVGPAGELLAVSPPGNPLQPGTTHTARIETPAGPGQGGAVRVMALAAPGPLPEMPPMGPAGPALTAAVVSSAPQRATIVCRLE